MNLIKHVAIIMDGNGRWGIKKKKSRNFGHKEGLKTVERIIKASLKSYIYSNWSIGIPSPMSMIGMLSRTG